MLNLNADSNKLFKVRDDAEDTYLLFTHMTMKFGLLTTIEIFPGGQTVK